MRLVVIGGDHPRHLYFHNKLNAVFGCCGALIEHREHMVPLPPPGIPEVDRANFVRHFANREEAEFRYFGIQRTPGCELKLVAPDELNSDESASFLKSLRPDVVVVFGSGLIKGALAAVLPRWTVNLHLGLSPRYRGSATLFWPFYFLEPTFAGSTFHLIVEEPDFGDIVHQVVPLLAEDDHIHDVGCKVVLDSAEAAVGIVRRFEKSGTLCTRRQKWTGRNFLSSDFRPEHLRVIYNLFDDDIVKQHLHRNLTCRVPVLATQF